MLEEAISVSVIVPCHNVAGVLRHCLDSVRDALPESGEIVAVDDGSSDATGEILKSYAEDNSCVRVIALEKCRGVSAARNAALAAVRGEYIQFVDADDTVEPGFCQKMIAAMECDKADYCVCGYWQVRRESAAERKVVRLKAPYHYTSAEEIRRHYLPRILGYSLKDLGGWLLGRDMYAKKRESGEVWRGCYRRAIIEERGLRFAEDVVLNEDALFTAAYLLAAKSMTSVDEPLYNYSIENDASALGSIRNAPRQYCANKLEILRERNRLNAAAGGQLAALYRGSNWLSLGEIAVQTLKGKVPRREGGRILKAYLKEMFK